jgi:hypothetical protein
MRQGLRRLAGSGVVACQAVARGAVARARVRGRWQCPRECVVREGKLVSWEILGLENDHDDGQYALPSMDYAGSQN